MADHISDALLLCAGNFFSHLFIIVGIWGMMATPIAPPDRNSPAISMKMLSGNRVLGPIKKLNTPTMNIAPDNRVTWFMYLEKKGVKNHIRE